MPSDYLAVRDSCYAKKRKNNGGKISDEQKAECKKMAAIWYYKKHGKPVQDSNAALAEEGLPDAIDLEILDEQIEFFGSLEEWQKWSNGEGENDTN